MGDDESEKFETVKYYTRARRFPQLLGRMPDGTKIPGGPYTVQQLVAAIAIIVIGGMTIGTWGVFGGFGNIAVLFGSAFGAAFGIGRLPMNGRNPMYAVVGLFRSFNAPTTGRYKGGPIRLRRPRTVTHQATVYLGPLPGTQPMPAVEGAMGRDLAGGSDILQRRLLGRSRDVDDEPVPTPETSAPTGPLSGVQALLALADEGNDSGDDKQKAVR